MNYNEIKSSYNNLLNKLCNNSLGSVFAGLRDIVKDEHLESYSIQLENLGISYKYMLQYFEQGIEDPKRNEIYNNIALDLFYILDSVKRELLTDYNTSTFYSKIKYYKLNGLDLVSAISKRCETLEKIELLKLSQNSGIGLINEYKNLENLENDIFSLVYISRQKDVANLSIINNILSDTNEKEYYKELIISALTLSCLEYFDEDKIALLYHNYNTSDSVAIQIKSLIGIYMISFKHNDIIKFSKKIAELNKELNDNSLFDEDIKTIIMQFIKSSDTERITKKTHEDLIQRINKLDPSIFRKIKGFENSSLDDDENPDWQKIMEESGIDDKVKELSEMQMQGADILMATFARLKHFSFFQNIVNWFMPFHNDHYLIQQNKEFEKLLTVLNKTSFICDSDKFSFILAANSAPAAEKKMMVSQLESQNIELKELSLSELQTSRKIREKNIILYIQNIYRFYKLFNRAIDFDNPFKTTPFINESSIVNEEGNTASVLNIAAEFYFKRKYYNVATELFKKIISTNNCTFDTYQKLGLCYQSKENYLEAIDLYIKADILNSNNSWTLRHIASCYKSIGQTEKALSYYKHAESIDPDNLKLLMAIGNTYLTINKPGDALKYYYKVDYLSQSSEKVIRLISWCEFLVDNYERSIDALNRITKLSAEDYLNLGHVYIIRGMIKDAIKYYRQSLDHYNCDIEKFRLEYFGDSNFLEKKGLQKNTISIVYDAVVNN